MPSNLYDVLGVSKDATPEEGVFFPSCPFKRHLHSHTPAVRRAYRKKALQTHPDRLPQNVSLADKATAEEHFRRVNNAYEVLNNSENRKVCTSPPIRDHQRRNRH